MAKDILKEAIADAKAVREVALANAKAALEEAFTPRLQSMLSAKLSEDLNEEYDEDMDEAYMEDEKDKVDEMAYDEDEDMKEAYMEDEKDKVDEMYDEDEKDSMDEEIDLEEILSELELEEGKDEDKDMKKEGKDEADEDMKEGKMKDADEDMKEGKDEADEDMKEGKKKEELDEMGRPVYKAEEANYAGYTADRVHEDKEFDLDALLEEINNLDEKEDKDDVKKEGKDEADEDMKEGKKKEELDEMGRPIYKAEDANYAGYTADRVHEDKEFNLDALLEEINNLDEEKEDDVNEQTDAEMDQMYAGSRLHKKREEGPRDKYRDRYDDDADIDYYKSRFEEGEETNEVVGVAAGIAGLIAAAGGLSALEMAADDPEWRAKYPKVARALEKMQDIGKAAADAKRMEETAKDKELDETKAALEAVTTELNEVNLLNSKLLYVNRIFKANTLNEAQKLRVVETLDNASNVKEAKLIYETIKDTFTVAKTTKTTPKRSIKEGLGMASKAAGTSTAPKKPVLNESNDMVTRMQKLANIKINQ